MSLKESNALLTTAFLVTIGVNASGFAQQFDPSEGVIRITANKTSSQARPSNGQVIQQTSTDQSAGAMTPVANASNNNLAQTGACPNCPANGGGWMNDGFNQGQCQCPHCRRCRGGCGAFRQHYCSRPPGYGYSPPAKYPLNRFGIEFANYYPNHWYGTGNDYVQSNAPMVYQPTDTSQLGFYYQQVPYWHPQPWRLPPRPIPAEWNVTAPAVASSGLLGPGPYYGCPNCWGSGYFEAGYPRRTLLGWGGHRGGYPYGYDMPAYGMTTPAATSPTPTAVPANQPQPTTVQPEPVPPNAPPNPGDGVAPAPIQTNTTQVPQLPPVPPVSGPTPNPPANSLGQIKSNPGTIRPVSATSPQIPAVVPPPLLGNPGTFVPPSPSKRG